MLNGVVIHNEVGEIIQYNQAALNILGLSEDQLMGRTSFDPMWRTVNLDLSPATPDTHPSTIASQQRVIVRDRIMGVYVPNGSLTWMNITAVPLFKEKSKEIDQVVVTFNDITELIVRTEELGRLKDEMAEREKNIQVLFDSLPALVGHWDRDLINVRSNKLYADYFGKTPDEVKGKHIRELLGEQLFEKNQVHMEKVLAGETQTFERDIATTNGVRNTISTYIPDASDDEVKGFYVLVYDVTDMKKLERDQKEAEAKLLGNVRLSWLGEMAGGVAHEINNPLAIMMGNLAVAKMKMERNELAADDLSKTFARLEVSIERIAKIVKSLVQFSGKGVEVSPQQFKISEVIEEMIPLMSQKLQMLSVKFETEPYEDDFLTFKKVEIMQSLMALIFNSIDAIQDQPNRWIKLKILNGEREIAFIVKDSGPKIPQYIAEKLMLPFFTTKPPGQGVGLGLSVAKSIANNYQGDLIYDAEAPHTTFIFKLAK
jgi:PAS domain S-box-containing protein